MPERRPLEASGPSADLYARVARRYRHPTFDLDTAFVSGIRAPVLERIVLTAPFWTLTAFDRLSPALNAPVPSVLVLPPLAGHCPTLVRDTVAAFLPCHAVYVANWTDARNVPLSAGAFGLGEAAEAIAAMVEAIAEPVHVVAITEAGVVGITAAALLIARGIQLATLTLLGGPVDCRADHARLATRADQLGLDWFVRAVIAPVPSAFEGAYREIFPGSFALTGFLTNTLSHSLADHKELFLNLTAGDGDTADGHRNFFDEFLSVMDVPAEFVLQWIETVLIDRPFTPDLAHPTIPQSRAPLAGTPLMTVEAELDAFGGGGQTHAVHSMTNTLSNGSYHTEQGVGRFALFNGARWRASIFPRVADFIANHSDYPATPCLDQNEDLLTLPSLTPCLALRLNRHGIYFAHQLARLDDAAAHTLGRRIGAGAHLIVAQLSREARNRLRESGRP